MPAAPLRHAHRWPPPGDVGRDAGRCGQVFFRESSFLKMLPALLPAAEADMAEQKALNVVAVLGVLRLTVAATLPAVERATNQSVPIWIPTTRFKSLLSSRSPLKSD
jgi:hypothetical protein